MQDSTIRESIIHIGFPKCGSTFLQNEIFPHLNYEIKDATKYFELGMLFLKDIKSKTILNLPNEKNYILGLESFMLLEVPMAWRKYGEYMQKNIFISNFKQLFKEEKLLIVIRRQDTIVQSWIRFKFGFYNKKYFFIDFPISSGNIRMSKDGELTEKNWGSLKNKYGVTYTHTFDYYDIISRLCDDKKRVKILLFEDLKYNKQKFYKELGDFVGEDLSRFINFNKKSNVSYYNPEKLRLIPEKSILSYIKHLLPLSLRLKIKRLIIKEKNDTKFNNNTKFNQEIMELYKDGNKRLDKEFNLGMKKYGYY